jgi:hypothetical protein
LHKIADSPGRQQTDLGLLLGPPAAPLPTVALPWCLQGCFSHAGPPDDGPYRGRYHEHERYERYDRPPYDRHYERHYDGPPGELPGAATHSSLQSCLEPPWHGCPLHILVRAGRAYAALCLQVRTSGSGTSGTGRRPTSATGARPLACPASHAACPAGLPFGHGKQCSCSSHAARMLSPVAAAQVRPAPPLPAPRRVRRRWAAAATQVCAGTSPVPLRRRPSSDMAGYGGVQPACCQAIFTQAQQLGGSCHLACTLLCKGVRPLACAPPPPPFFRQQGLLRWAPG